MISCWQAHTEWVTRVLFEHTTGNLVSSSLDSTIKCADASRQKVVLDIKHHSKGVHDLAWIVDYSQFVSCGLERDLILWQGTTGRKTGSLVGHTSSVIGVTVDQAHNMVYSLSIDKMIKVTAGAGSHYNSAQSALFRILIKIEYGFKTT